MTSKSYTNEKYIIYFEDKKQYTRANNTSIFNLYDTDTLMSMWVFFRTNDYHICNKGWKLYAENGRAAFSLFVNNKEIKVISTKPITDAKWHLLCWGKYNVNNKVRLFLVVDAGYINESEDIDSDVNLSNDYYFQIARFGYATYSRIWADELFIVKGIKYTNSIGLDIYNEGIMFPGYPPDLWSNKELKCYWIFNQPGIVEDQSGNNNHGQHFNDPKIASHISWPD